MIEKIIESIIKELGPTGLLVIGLYYILDKVSRKLIEELKVINDEIGEIAEALNKIAEAKNRRWNGKV
ncbi:MAG: hypothetical protein DRO11_03855 [Methanobacteriota archaeon]|nr:MAG: hypothetical protein DRO11_03855 [Euryarchaeota archaeon]